MAALVVKTLLRVLSPLTAPAGSRREAFVMLLRPATPASRCARTSARCRRGSREYPCDSIQLGIHVVKTHFHVGEPLSQTGEVCPTGHAELLQCLQHGLLYRLTERRRYLQVRIQHGACRLGVGLTIHGFHHGFGPGVQIGVPHLPERGHGVELGAVACWFVGHCTVLSSPAVGRGPRRFGQVYRVLRAIYKLAVCKPSFRETGWLRLRRSTWPPSSAAWRQCPRPFSESPSEHPSCAAVTPPGCRRTPRTAAPPFRTPPCSALQQTLKPFFALRRNTPLTSGTAWSARWSGWKTTPDRPWRSQPGCGFAPGPDRWLASGLPRWCRTPAQPDRRWDSPATRGCSG